ncbi:C2H2-type zinc finger protein, partial [Sansalvadorimonas verongulae]|uniref:C2H2-type zinc finger protein n=1 Tax=Sansalvadorimonas verongulae TaxID=2172824 RepID=UPI001E445765
SPSFLDTLFPELSGLKQDDTLLSELSDLLQDDVFQGVLCASEEECALDIGGTLTEVNQIQSDSDQQPTNISGMNTLRAHTGYRRTHKRRRLFVCDFDGCNHLLLHPVHLTIHKRIHTGERPFACDLDGCNKALTTSVIMTDAASLSLNPAISSGTNASTQGTDPLSL